MVSIYSRKQIKKVTAFVLIGMALVLGIVWASQNKVFKGQNSPQYSATNQALDLEVVAGIHDVEHDTFAPKVDTARAVVVPHHLVSRKAIALGVRSVATTSTKRVIIISPDHFARCKTLLCTTAGTFKTFFGDAVVDTRAVSQLKKSDLVRESNLFTDEHGIYTIVPFVKRYAPQAEIIPIVISQNFKETESDREEIVRLLQPFLKDKNTVLIISSDFSHYLPLGETRVKDRITQKVFCSGDSKNIVTLENPSQSDCPLCLFVAEESAKRAGFWNPVLLAHTNSAELLNDVSAKEITSHFTFALLEKQTDPLLCTTEFPRVSVLQESPVNSVRILFTGDMMYDRYIRKISSTKGQDYILSCIDPVLQSVDTVVGNLEGPITNNKSVSLGSIVGSPNNYQFTFATSTAELLKRHNFNIVNIGNNHIGNFGLGGITSTQEYLERAGVAYFGGLSGSDPVHRVTIKGIPISFVSYNQFGGDSVDTIARVITEEKNKGNTVVVYTHWGEEYIDATPQIKRFAHVFVDSGADLIVGSHPHVVQSNELYKGVPIYYSLGNFVFDQYFSEAVKHGLTLLVDFPKKESGKGIQVKEIPVEISTDGRVCPML